MENVDIRIIVSGKGLTYRQIAAEMGVTSVYLSRVMAVQLKPMMRIRILNAIDSLEEKRTEKTDCAVTIENKPVEEKLVKKSVLIVDTPKNCETCILCYEYDLEKSFCAGANGKYVPKSGKAKWCPLVSE